MKIGWAVGVISLSTITAFIGICKLERIQAFEIPSLQNKLLSLICQALKQALNKVCIILESGRIDILALKSGKITRREHLP